jgi:hypothetical protein
MGGVKTTFIFPIAHDASGERCDHDHRSRHAVLHHTVAKARSYGRVQSFERGVESRRRCREQLILERLLGTRLDTR